MNYRDSLLLQRRRQETPTKWAPAAKAVLQSFYCA